MPQFHLLCWDDERRLSDRPSRRQRQQIIAVFGIDLGCPIIESRSRAHDTVSLDAHPCHETEALIFPKLFRVCRPVVN